MKPAHLIVAASMLAVGAAGPAMAAGDAMTVTATVVAGCHLDAGDMAFGTLDSREPRASAQAVLTLDCSPGTAFRMTLDQGRQGSRRMADPAGVQFLDYEIYQDAAASRVWGSDAAGAVAGVADGDGRVTLSAHGRVTAERAAAGAYSDIVTVAVSF